MKVLTAVLDMSLMSVRPRIGHAWLTPSLFIHSQTVSTGESELTILIVHVCEILSSNQL